MKLSICTIGLRDRKADEAFRIIAECGYFNADCLAYSPTAHVNRSMDVEQRKAVVALAAKHGAKICSLAGIAGDKIASENVTDRQQAVKEIKAEVDLATDLGASVARVSAGGEILSPILERAIPHLKEAADYAQSKGVCLPDTRDMYRLNMRAAGIPNINFLRQRKACVRSENSCCHGSR